MKTNALFRQTLSLLILITVAVLETAGGDVMAATIQISASGSTFGYPMYAKWFEAYRKVDPNVVFTYQATGSGAGIHDVMLGTVDLGASDGPLTKTQMLDFSTHRNCEVLHFPMALGADVPIYNISGVTQSLNFTPQALAGIYLGKITKWNDVEIARANPGIALPGHQIVVVHRSDGSGTTYAWTDYLSKVNSQWRERIGTSIAVIWPVGFGARGNQGVTNLVRRTPYAIGYTELTYAVRNSIPYGDVKNQAGFFIKANFASVTAAAASMARNMPEDFRVSITNAPGKNAYPISTFTWLLVPSVISDQAKKTAIVDFLHWALTKGQDFLEPLSYARLPSGVIASEEQAIEKIK